MRPKRFPDCCDPEFEALMAELDPEDDQNPVNKYEEIETISSGIDADKILSGQAVRMPSGEWKVIE